MNDSTAVAHAIAPSLADWHASLDAIRALGHPPSACEQLMLAGATGRVLAEPAATLPAGTLLHWRHLPLLVAAGVRTLSVRPRLRAGIVALGEGATSSAALIAAAFEQLGGRALAAAAPEPPERLGVALEMFAGRCELVFVIADDPVPRWFRFGESMQVIVLAPRLRCALAAFVTEAVPLIRRMQGRGDALPPTHVVDVPGAGPGMTLVHERLAEDQRMLMRPCGLSPACLAGAAGIAWAPPELDGRHLYLPFEAWLR